LNNELAIPLSLSGALYNPLYSDVTFVVEEQQLSAHRAVLAARSIYFHTMFLGGFTESQKGHVTIPVEEVSHEVFKLVLEFVYTGSNTFLYVLFKIKILLSV
jgi:hypothetical protein